MLMPTCAFRARRINKAAAANLHAGQRQKQRLEARGPGTRPSGPHISRELKKVTQDKQTKMQSQRKPLWPLPWVPIYGELDRQRPSTVLTPGSEPRRLIHVRVSSACQPREPGL